MVSVTSLNPNFKELPIELTTMPRISALSPFPEGILIADLRRFPDIFSSGSVLYTPSFLSSFYSSSFKLSSKLSTSIPPAFRKSSKSKFASSSSPPPTAGLSPASSNAILSDLSLSAASA